MSLWRRNITVVAALLITGLLFLHLDLPVEQAIHDFNYFSSSAKNHTEAEYIPDVTHISSPTIATPETAPEPHPNEANSNLVPVEAVPGATLEDTDPERPPVETNPEQPPPKEEHLEPLPAETVPESLDLETVPDLPAGGLDPAPHPAAPGTHPANPEPIAAEQTSRLHFLIPASGSNLHFCFNLASAAANRYPVPVLVGYNGTGEFDAAATHLAKLRSIERYLNGLGRVDDDDLVLIVDGYDIILQLPPEILIDRYFEVAGKADGRLAARLGISVQEARERGIRTSIFWGPDKICWPVDWAAPRCWSVPPSPLQQDAHGPDTDNGDMLFSNPRWLNSGTVLGRVADMKSLIAGTMDEIDATYDPDYEFRESDQYYVSNVWGRQEYHRSIMAEHGGIPEGGPPDRRIPEQRYEGQRVEYHVGLDYESALFFPRGANEPFYDYLPFDTSGLNAHVEEDVIGLGDRFVPYDIPLPANIMTALGRLYESISDAHDWPETNVWIRTIKLGVSLITNQIYPLWHCTGTKEPIRTEYTMMWFYPYAKSLIKATVRAFQSGELITSYPVQGRRWAPKMTYPSVHELRDELGGAWTDYEGLNFVEWNELCGPYADDLFRGEVSPGTEEG